MNYWQYQDPNPVSVAKFAWFGNESKMNPKRIQPVGCRRWQSRVCALVSPCWSCHQPTRVLCPPGQQSPELLSVCISPGRSSAVGWDLGLMLSSLGSKLLWLLALTHLGLPLPWLSSDSFSMLSKLSSSSRSLLTSDILFLKLCL